MRIGVDARELGGAPTGVGRYTVELLARWTRAPWTAGHTLVLFSPRALDETAGWRGEGGATCVVEHVPGGGGTLWEQGALARAVRRADLDVFHATGYTAPLRLRVPLVVAMHDVSFAAHPEWFRWREGLRQRTMARCTARRARHIVTLTRFSRDEIVRHFRVSASKVHVIPPAVDAHPALMTGPRHARDEAPAHSPYVLHVGSIFTRRHVPTLIDAFADVARTRPDLRLVIVGADRTYPRQAIGQRIRQSGVAGQIDWQPWVPEPDLRALYAGARAFAFLSEYEGFGLTPLEALAHGVPPLVANVPIAREAYGPAAAYVDPRNREEVARTLRALLDDGAVRQRVLKAAPEVLGRYSWDVSARSTFDVLLSAGASGAAPR
jgi:glycosyltransferase involved in cell wall biosynthesis